MKTNLIQDLISLVYPRLCLACGQNLPPRQAFLCISCEYALPQTHFHLYSDNPFTEHFWGRVDLVAAAAMYFFSKGGRAQELIHQLKYKGRKEVGTGLGRLYGSQLKSIPIFRDIQAIVPVPLHPRKEQERGYNQSALFAAGLSESMSVPSYPHALRRRAFTETQTRKSRFERLENVGEVFEVAQPHLLKGKFVLLVDDVVTTGATLEACARILLEVPGLRLGMATIAFAKN